MSDTNFASHVDSLTGGTADTFIVCAGPTSVVVEKTVAEVKTILGVDSKIGGSVGSTTNRLVKSSGTDTLTVQSTGITVDASNNVSGVGTLSLGSNDLTCGVITTSVSDAKYTHTQRGAYFGWRDGFPVVTGANGLGGFTSRDSGLTVGRNSKIGWNSASTLSGGAIDTWLESPSSGLVCQRNGLNAQTYELFETYTSGTSYGSLCLKATASGHQIGSARGSAGGSNRAVQLGHFNSAGSFTSGLSVATDGAVTCGAITASGKVRSNCAVVGGNGGVGAGGVHFETTFTGYGMSCNSNGEPVAVVNNMSRVRLGTNVVVGSNGGYAFGDVSHAGMNGTLDTMLGRSSAGVVEINNGTPNNLRDFRARNITATGATNFAPITKAALLMLTPDAATGGRWRVTDATPTNRAAYPTGTDWRYSSDDTVVT